MISVTMKLNFWIEKYFSNIVAKFDSWPIPNLLSAIAQIHPLRFAIVANSAIAILPCLQTNDSIFRPVIKIAVSNGDTPTSLADLFSTLKYERSRGHKTHCFPEVSVNKYFVM